jgi:hypothetical protein
MGVAQNSIGYQRATGGLEEPPLFCQKAEIGGFNVRWVSYMRLDAQAI